MKLPTVNTRKGRQKNIESELEMNSHLTKQIEAAPEIITPSESSRAQGKNNRKNDGTNTESTRLKKSYIRSKNGNGNWSTYKKKNGPKRAQNKVRNLGIQMRKNL